MHGKGSARHAAQIHPGGTVTTVSTNNAPSVARRKKIRVTLDAPPADSGGNRSQVASRLWAWTPATPASDDLLGFARAVAWTSGADSVQSALRIARVALAHADRLTADGLPLDPAFALTRDQVEATIARRAGDGAPLGSSDVSALRTAAQEINPLGGWAVSAATHSRRLLKTPYTADEQAALLRAAQVLPTARRRRETTAAMCL